VSRGTGACASAREGRSATINGTHAHVDVVVEVVVVVVFPLTS
jgi:hypothetical protein